MRKVREMREGGCAKDRTCALGTEMRDATCSFGDLLLTLVPALG
jgi:hypothetical protein